MDSVWVCVVFYDFRYENRGLCTVNIRTFTYPKRLLPNARLFLYIICCNVSSTTFPYNKRYLFDIVPEFTFVIFSEFRNCLEVILEKSFAFPRNVGEHWRMTEWCVCGCGWQWHCDHDILQLQFCFCDCQWHFSESLCETQLCLRRRKYFRTKRLCVCVCAWDNEEKDKETYVVREFCRWQIFAYDISSLRSTVVLPGHNDK